jgi:protein SCO1
MLRTAVACLLLLCGAYAVAGRLTHGWQAWTEEGARRLEVALQPVATPAVVVEGPATPSRALDALLANGRDVTIVEFMYTQCESVCLALGSGFQQLQAALQADRADAHVRLLSISFDGARDGVPELAAYATRMHADARWWQFVRVADAGGTQRLLANFRVTVVPDGHGDFQHNAALLVVDRQGRLVRIFDLAEQQLAFDFARHLAAGGRV